jgi:hypothetical protein
MRPPNSITLHCDASEDRILVAINAGRVDAAGYWLTRRLALKLIQAANPYLDRMSPVLSKTPTALRSELAAMEREVALASTQKNVSPTPDGALESVSLAAELAIELSITRKQQGFGLKFRGRKGRETTVGCSKAELQRIIHTVEREVVKASWREGPPPAERQPSEKEPKRRAH